MKPYRGLFCSLLLLLLAGSGTLAAEPPYRIVIFHTNDIHGKIAPLAKIARLVNAERRANPDVFLFGAGDNFSGNPVVDQAQPQGQPMLELFNRLGYNLVNLGNHEFDYGQQTLAYHLSHAHYGVVCANLKVKQGPLSQPKPYAILRTSHGDRLAVLGLIQVSRATSLPDSHPDKLKGLRFSEPLAAAQKFKNLRGRVQVFIALTHLGYEQDLLLAQAMPELDLIIGGHSHTAVLEPKEINGVLVTQAGSDGLYLGRVDITLAGGRVSDKRATLIDLAKVTEEDPQVKTLIDHFNDSPALQRVIARLPLPLSGKEEIGSLVTDAMRTVHRLDIAFQNNGGIRLAELRGEVPAQGYLPARSLRQRGDPIGDGRGRDPFADRLLLRTTQRHRPAGVRSAVPRAPDPGPAAAERRAARRSGRAARRRPALPRRTEQLPGQRLRVRASRPGRLAQNDHGRNPDPVSAKRRRSLPLPRGAAVPDWKPFPTIDQRRRGEPKWPSSIFAIPP